MTVAPDTALRDAIAQAEADTNRNPSDAAKKAGNYRKGRFTLAGMQVVVETPKGTERSGTDRNGNSWSTTLPATYGYISKTEGADGDQVDVYIGPEPESDIVYVVDQVVPETGLFDEHKVMIGYPSIKEAVADYDAAFSDGSGPRRRGDVVSVHMGAFKRWVDGGFHGLPMSTVRAGDGTRTKTPEGLLRAGAVLTRAGPIDYSRAELGLDGDGMITVTRTMETLQHPDTLASLRGAPITVGHPEGGVTPDNWKDVVVGAVAGEPAMDSNTIMGNVLVGDREALDRLDQGIDELSIGYDFHLSPEGDTVGPLIINHVAIVERGRAGSAVRVLDQQPEANMPEHLSKKDIEDAMSAAMDTFMDGWMKKHGDTSMSTSDMGRMKHDMAAAVADAMKPMMDGMKAMQDTAAALQTAEDERKAAADAATAQQKAKDAAKALEDNVRGEERARFAVITDVLPLIPEDKRVGLELKDTKDILVLAVGDHVPDAANQSVDYLRGVTQMMKRQVSATAQPAIGTGLPPGVMSFDAQPLSSVDARTDAMNKFIAAQADAYHKAGGV